jgi:hypothetical protein
MSKSLIPYYTNKKNQSQHRESIKIHPVLVKQIPQQEFHLSTHGKFLNEPLGRGALARKTHA